MPSGRGFPMRRLSLAVALVLSAAPAAAMTLPVYRDAFGVPGMLSAVDVATRGPIVAVFDTAADHAATSLLLPDAPVGFDPIRLATSCEIHGCFEGFPYELALNTR